MNELKRYQFLNYFFSLIWFVNGFLCKIFDLEPRHQEIVGRILGEEHSRIFTVIIGVLEVAMCVWILSKFFPRLNAIVQIVIVLTMNVIEFFVVPGLLLWGNFNLVFALLFVTLIYYKEFILKKEIENVVS